MSWTRSFAAALAVVALASCNARANMINWSYNWKPSATSLGGDGGSGNIMLTNEAMRNASGSSDIVATNLHVSSSASRQSPDHFGHAGYSLTLTVTDAESHLSGNLTFTGFFSGTISGNTSNLANTFTGVLSQQLTLGHHVYTVTIDNYSAPGPPGAANGGSIGAHVNANLRVDPPVHSAPEPTSLALAGLGLGGCALTYWRRKKESARYAPPA